MAFCLRLLICLSLWAVAPSMQAAQLELGVLDLKPFGYQDKNGAIKGDIADLFRQIATGANYTYRLRLAPHARLLSDLNTGAVDMAVLIDDVSSNARAEVLVKLPASPIHLVLRKGLSFASLTPETKIGQVRGSTFRNLVLEVPPVQWVYYNKTAQGVAMLERGRLDGFISSEAAYLEALRELDTQPLPGAQVEVLGRVSGGVFLSRQSPYIKDLDKIKRSAQRAVASILARARQAEEKRVLSH